METLRCDDPNLKGVLFKDNTNLWTDENGGWHREDGPAFINKRTHTLAFYINDKQISKDEWLQWLKDGHSSLSTNEVTRLILEWS
jgi:hypothetical protein